MQSETLDMPQDLKGGDSGEMKWTQVEKG